MRKRDIMQINLPYANTVDVNAIRSDLVIYFEKKMSESRQRTYSFCFSFIVCMFIVKCPAKLWFNVELTWQRHLFRLRKDETKN